MGEGRAQVVLSQLAEDRLAVQEVIPLLKDESPAVRASACLSLGRWTKSQSQPGDKTENAVINSLVNAAEDPNNSIRIMGKQVSDFAVLSLLTMQRPGADKAALRSMEDWILADRYLLLSWAGRLDLMSESDLSSYHAEQDRIRSSILPQRR
jgi:HEAT repeat protein